MKVFKLSMCMCLLLAASVLAPFISYSSVNNDGLFGVIYFLMVPLLLVLAVHIGWDLRRFYIPIVPFVVFSVAFYWLSFYLLQQHSTYEISSETYMVSILCYVSLIITYFILTIVFPSSVYDIDKLKLDMYEASSAAVDELELLWKIGVFLAFFFTTLFFVKAGNIPMFASNPELARVEAMKGAGTIQRLSYLPMYFAIFSLSILLWLRKETVSKTHIAIIIAFVLYNMLTGPRSYALWVPIYLFISLSLLNSGRIRVRKALGLLLLVFSIIAVVGGVRYSGLQSFNIEDTIIRFVNRIYMNPVNADRIVDAFHYASISKNSFLIEVEVLLPGYQPDLGTVLKEYVGAEFDGGGITVPLPAEGYMNYGVFGAALYGVIFALLLKVFEFVLSRIRNPFYRYTFLVMFSIQFMGVVTMGLSGILVKTTFPAVVTFMIILFVMRIYKNIKRVSE